MTVRSVCRLGADLQLQPGLRGEQEDLLPLRGGELLGLPGGAAYGEATPILSQPHGRCVTPPRDGIVTRGPLYDTLVMALTLRDPLVL